jgi:hypothetical protein
MSKLKNGNSEEKKKRIDALSRTPNIMALVYFFK